MTPWYKALYENFQDYDSEPYTKNTEQEVHFLIKQFGNSFPKKVLDVGCGTGRHAIILAEQGYDVTGIDLSEDLVRQAREKAKQMGLSVNFVIQDAVTLPYQVEFDAAILMCEGAFSMMETDEKEQSILDGVARALRPGAAFIMTTTNVLFMLTQGNPDFDPLTFRETFTLESTDIENEPYTLTCEQRYYAPPELRRMLEYAGFEGVSFFAVTEDGFDETIKPDHTQFEFGVICRREG